MINEYNNPLGSLMGTLSKEDPRNSGPEYNIKFMQSTFQSILNKSSELKVISINTDSSEGRAKYAEIMNDPNIRIVDKNGFIANYEESSEDSRSKDTYWKIIFEYREINFGKFVEGMKQAVKSKIYSAALAVSLIADQVPGLVPKLEEMKKELLIIEEEAKNASTNKTA